MYCVWCSKHHGQDGFCCWQRGLWMAIPAFVRDWYRHYDYSFPFFWWKGQ